MIYNLATFFQIVIAAACLWICWVMLFVGPPVKRVDYIRVWVFSSIAIDQVYWTAARILTFTSGDWYKWEFEHDVIVLFLKGNFMASMLVLIFYYVFVEYVHKKKI